MESAESKKKIPNWVYIVTALIIIVIVPGVMAALMIHPRFSGAPGGIDGWLSYWGGYLGGVIGMIAVVTTTAYLIKKQDINHQEQMKIQDHQHLELLRDQDRHHRDQIEEQGMAIERAAKLNDQTERDRIHASFLLKQNEEILELLVRTSNLNLKRINSIRHIADYIEHIKTVKSDLRYLEHTPIFDNKVEEKKELRTEIKKRSEKLDALQDEEVKFREEILSVLVNLQIKSDYFPQHSERVWEFTGLLQSSFEEYSSCMQSGELPVEQLRKNAEEFQRVIENETNVILTLLKNELLESLRRFRNKGI